MVHHGERITPGTVLGLELPLEVRRPDIIRFAHGREGLLTSGDPLATFLWMDRSLLRKDVVDGRLGRNVPLGVIFLQWHLDLFGPWRIPLFGSQVNDRLANNVRRTKRMLMRPSGLIVQPLNAKFLVTGYPLSNRSCG